MKKLCVCLALALACVMPTAAHAEPIEFGADRPGGDYHNFRLSTDDPMLCRGACEADENCTAWTYARRGHRSVPHPMCFIKNEQPAPVDNICCVSGTIDRK